MRNLYWFRFTQLLLFILKGKSKYRIHSPFTFRLIKECFESDHLLEDQDFSSIEKIKKEWRHNNEIIQGPSFGAGSNYVSNGTIGEIVRYSVSSTSKLRLLYKLSRYCSPNSIIECGTSLGLSSCYLSTSVNGSYTGIEGNKKLAEIAKSNLKRLAIGGKIVNGLIMDHLPTLVSESGGDAIMIVLDGDHKSASLSVQIQAIINTNPKKQVYIIVDDIRWNQDMYVGWKSICEIEQVDLSLDFFQFGLLVLNMNVEKQSIAVFNINQLLSSI